jgi:hypothetical protein
VLNQNKPHRFCIRITKGIEFIPQSLHPRMNPHLAGDS